jgi:hypothetical protein
MLYVFVGALVLGGVVLSASLLVGDGHGDVDHELGVHIDADGIDVIIGAFRSLRFWIFFLTFFGMTGVALLQLGVTTSTVLSTVSAVGMGLFAGYGAVWAYRTLNKRESNSLAGENDLIGKTGRIMVGVSPTVLGKLRVQVKGSTVDLLAKSDETFAIDDEAIVIEMDGTMVRIAHVETGANAPLGD